MTEAFRRHIPIWIFLVSALAVAIGLVLVLGQNGQPTTEPATSTPTNNRSSTLGAIGLRYIATGFSETVDIVSTGIDGDERLFIVEKVGKVRLLDQNSEEISVKPLLNISDRVINQDEMGLLGLAFDPDLRQNPYIYVNYVHPTSGGRETVIARYTLNADQTQADAASEKIILRVSQPYANHKAGDLVFGPDGYLYVPLGDGGSGGDPQNNGQNPKSLLGKILRLDVHTLKAYEVPSDNPFVDDKNFRPEIWSLGWRNPWRISFDGQTGDLWVGDVGQNKVEEIDHEPKATGGRNYGWRCYEGASVFKTAGCKDKSSYTFPVAQYEHSNPTCDSITGGFVYRGQDYPDLAGYYFYADYCRGDIYALNSTEATFTARLIKDTGLSISTFGEDNRGEVFLADMMSGTIYQLTSH